MNEFLFYPELEFIAKNNNREILAWFPLVEKNYCSKKDYSDNEFVDFAFIDDTNTDKELHCVVVLKLTGDSIIVKGSERITEAKELIKQKFTEYCEIHYPQGLHWVEVENEYGNKDTGLYLGNNLLAKIFQTNKVYEDLRPVYKAAVKSFHTPKFFADKSENEEQATRLIFEGVKFGIDKVAIAKEKLNALIDLERYEKNKADAQVKKREEQAANNDFLGLPELEGSEKQIKWAHDLRMQFVERFGVDNLSEKKWKLTAKIAKFWIDNRFLSTSDLAALAFLK